MTINDLRKLIADVDGELQVVFYDRDAVGGNQFFGIRFGVLCVDDGGRKGFALTNDSKGIQRPEVSGD